MKLRVDNPGLFSTVQDLGRWGYQLSGVPVAGAMDGPALRLGNVLLGNPQGAAGIEMTLLGAAFTVEEEGYFVVTGGEMGLCLDGKPAPSWQVHYAPIGARISFSGGLDGSRAYLCIAGGVDVPLVMGSASTYTRGNFGGYEGRSLKRGDVLVSGTADLLAARSVGLCLPAELRPDISNRPLPVIPGPQEDAFTEAGQRTFFESEYSITQESDRMGCRFEGPVIEHVQGADIISDGITLGAIQIPGHGKPIALLADRQTTGGYTKIGVLSPVGLEILAQRRVGESVRFRRATRQEGVEEIRAFNRLCEEAEKLRAVWRSRAAQPAVSSRSAFSGNFLLTLEGQVYDVSVQSLED